MTSRSLRLKMSDMPHPSPDCLKLPLLSPGKGPVVIQRTSSRNHALDTLNLIARRHTRLGICGRPGVGKTHLASSLAVERGYRLLSTDAFKDLSWELQKIECYQAAMKDEAEPLVVEGVTVARIAKMQPPPFDALVLLKGHDRMRVVHGTSYKREALGHSVEKWAYESALPIYEVHLNY